VARRDGVESPGHGREVESPLQSDRERKVVVRLARVELLEEPEALLSEGEGSGRAGVAAGDV
jgi:hypothetical protein